MHCQKKSAVHFRWREPGVRRSKRLCWGAGVLKAEYWNLGSGGGFVVSYRFLFAMTKSATGALVVTASSPSIGS